MTRRQHSPNIFSRQLPDGQFEVYNKADDTTTVMARDDLILLVKADRDPGRVELGDMVERFLNRVGVKKTCLPCAERQAALNRLLKRPPGW